MQYQLRLYTVRPGAMEDWLAEWRAQVLPLRRKFGFELVGPWVSDEDSLFVWILGYAGEDWEAVDTAYYDSPERMSMTPDPARHLVETKHMMVRTLERE